MKSKRAVDKPKNEGPAGYVFPGDDPRPGNQAELLRTLQVQGCEIHRATAPFTVTFKGKKKPSSPAPSESPSPTGSPSPAATPSGAVPRVSPTPSPLPSPTPAPSPKLEAEQRTFPAGSYIVRMDQPYSRIADALLDYQYWAPNDPQQDVYDDTGWTMGELGNVKVVRVTDVKALSASMERVNGDVRAPAVVSGGGSVYLVNHNADNALVTLRYRLKDVAFEAAEEPFEAGGKKFNRGSFIIRKADLSQLRQAATELGLQVTVVESAPTVKTHPVRAPRIAVMHTWLSTQDEGWWRLALDQLGVPFSYISTQDAAKDPDLRRKYDVIIFAPVGRGASAIIGGLPMWGNPIPWKTTPLTPNIGKIDSTDDIRPGLGFSGLMNLQKFTQEGGLFIGSMDTADLAVTAGFTPGLSITRSQRLKAIGAVLRSKVVDTASPISYGYDDSLAIYCFNGPIFNVSNFARGGGRPRREQRTTGRGTPDDPDTV
ncbi:MAG: M14 family zinc carboxypeptidase, partial [Pyrinomonadaceae bacterium]